jgi:biofilm PGA synthesis N-glycosyltransferase PgaC
VGYRSSYVMVTPIREQAGQLDDLAATVRAQERRPALWVIIDDGSTDDTAPRLQRLRLRDPWIHPVTLPSTPQAEPRRHAQLVTTGFRYAAELAEAEGIDHRYVVNLDADLRCPPQLVAELIERSERDRSVGIASCTITEVADDGRVERRRDVIDGIPRADLRVWRRACVEEVGLQPAPRWAETTGLRARNRGWLTPVFEDLVVEATRPGVVRHAWQGFRSHGAEGWEVGLHPLVLAGQVVAASVQDRDLRGVAMLAGYVEAAISGQRRSRDPELREYFGEGLLRHQARTLLSRVPMVGRRFRRQ